MVVDIKPTNYLPGVSGLSEFKVVVIGARMVGKSGKYLMRMIYCYAQFNYFLKTLLRILDKQLYMAFDC